MAIGNSAPPGASPRGFDPSSRVEGEWRAPASKSVAQRALVAAGLAHGRSELGPWPGGNDAQAAEGALRALGVEIVRKEAQLAVVGRPPQSGHDSAGGWCASRPVHVGESGTLARFLTACVGLAARPGTAVVLEGHGTLAARSLAPLLDCLRSAGVEIEESQGCHGRLPLRIRALGPPSVIELSEPCSSQEVSALLLALAAYPDPILLRVRGPIPSRPYVELTRGVLARFRASVSVLTTVAGTEFEVRGPLQAPGPLELEPDASSAAIALTAACLSGGELTVLGLSADSLQGDVRIVEHLAAFGCDARAGTAGLRAGGLPRNGADLDLSGEPDLAPPLAAVAVAAARGGASSTLRGLATLRGKESDRLAGLARFMAAVGVAARIEGDSLHCGPGQDERAPAHVLLDPQGDHRMVFAAALLGLTRPGVRCGAPEACAKSWPGFWDDLGRLGALRN